MELRQLRHFIAAVEDGNLSAATNKTFLSQPALSRSIKNLENELGVTLLERKARGVVPTEAGRQFYLEAKFILNECDRAVADLGALSRGVGSRVVVAASPMFMSNIAAVAAARVSAAAPGIDLAFIEANQGSVHELAEGRLDAVLAIFAQLSLPKNITKEHLCTVTAIVVAGSKNPISNKRKLSADDFASAKWAMMGYLPQGTDVVEQFMMANNLPPPNRAIRSNSVAFVKSLIIDHGFISMLPSHMLAAELAKKEIKALPMPTGHFRRPAGLLQRAGSDHRAGLGIVVDELKKACKEFAASHDY